METIHIALVDDDDSVREAMQNLISVLGYSVDAFDSAQAFLASKLLQTTDCVITDVQMPGMSGIDLQRRLHDGGHRMPVIFVTAYPDESTRACVIRNGAAGYLSKPLQKANLQDCLDKALNAGSAKSGLRR